MLIPALALATALGGCTLRARGYVRAPVLVIVEEEPPPPRRVLVVQRPGHLWIEGHWARDGGRWRWTDGYYERTRPDHDWVAGRWERRGSGHVWLSGRWQARGRARPRDQDHR